MDAQEAPARTARRLIRACGRAALATALEGWPYASLVLVATDCDGAPLLLLSDLAEHTKNLKREARASLLFDGTFGLADPLTGARVTLMGEASASEDPRALGRYVARHPSAAAYAGFRDFRLYRLAPHRAHLVAGFGRIHWIEAEELRSPVAAATALAEAEPAILAHMNGDHPAAIDLYARRLLGLSGEGWRLTGIDPDGADLRREAAEARLDFPAPVGDAEGVRAAFIALTDAARQVSGQGEEG